MKARTQVAIYHARPEALGPVFNAWRTRDTATPTRINLEPCSNLREAVDAACASCGHKDHLIVLEEHPVTGKQVIHVHAIRRESKAVWRRDPQTGNSVCIARLYPVLLFSMKVDAFVPAEPWAWSPSCDVVGLDRDEVRA